MLSLQEQGLHDQRINLIGKLDFMNELEAQLKENPPESFKAMLENFNSNRIQWRQSMNQMAIEEQALRDGRMQVIGAADNISYVEQTWENSARELAAEKAIIEGSS